MVSESNGLLEMCHRGTMKKSESQLERAQLCLGPAVTSDATKRDRTLGKEKYSLEMSRSLHGPFGRAV